MKRLICFILLSSAISGCAIPIAIDNGNNRRVFTPCTNDDLCFRDAYTVAWDNWSQSTSNDFPVSYRTKQTEYISKKIEYIFVPGTGDQVQAEVLNAGRY